MSTDSSKPWFAAKRYGLGAGLPIAWQGWALLVGYLLIVFSATTLLSRDVSKSMTYLPAYFIFTGIATLVFLVICAKKTRGGWHWRWGGKA